MSFSSAYLGEQKIAINPSKRIQIIRAAFGAGILLSCLAAIAAFAALIIYQTPKYGFYGGVACLFVVLWARTGTRHSRSIERNDWRVVLVDESDS